MKIKKAIQIFSVLFLSFAAQSVLAAVDTSVERYLSELNISDAVKREMRSSQFDTSKVIPLTMQATGNQSAVLSQVFDHCLDSTLNSETFKSSYIGKKTTHVRNTVNPKIQIGSKNSTSKLKFQVLSAQSKAVVTYEGYFNANFSYQVAGQVAAVEVGKNINPTTRLTYSLLNTKEDTVNTLALSLQF